MLQSRYKHGAGSAAIDQAPCTDVNAAPVTTDRRGVARPQGTVCDVGGVEVKPATPTPTRTPTRTPTTQSCNVKPSKPTLTAPADRRILTKSRVTLKWLAATCAQKYKVVVKDATTGKAVDKQRDSTVLKYKTDRLLTGRSFRWFVKACKVAFGCTKSAVRSLIVQ